MKGPFILTGFWEEICLLTKVGCGLKENFCEIYPTNFLGEKLVVLGFSLKKLNFLSSNNSRDANFDSVRTSFTLCPITI
jgi:hypothetical protein